MNISWAKDKLKNSNWFTWFIVFIIVIGTIIAIFNYRKEGYDLGDISMLDPDHIRQCNELINEHNINLEVSLIPPFSPTATKAKPKNRRWKREEMCRQILESIYEVPFKNCRPSFLKNPGSGHNLELDGYNEDLRIAFEHNGEHHYIFPNTFHKTEKDFRYQISKDKFKQEVCEREGIYLISIPYTIDKKNIRNYIIDRLPRDVSN